VYIAGVSSRAAKKKQIQEQQAKAAVSSAKGATQPNTPKPESFDIIIDRELDSRPPVVSNYVVASGSSDLVTIDFFYMHPKRLQRIEEHGGSMEDGYLVDSTFQIESAPVAQVALPLTTAIELMLQVFRTVMFGMPHMKAQLDRISPRMAEIADYAAKIAADFEAAQAGGEKAEVTENPAQ